MNEMPGKPEGEPQIIIICIDAKNFYLLKGEEYLQQVLLADGVYPKPVLCVNFKSVFDAAQLFGEGFSVAELWAVNPEIIGRLRETDSLVEKFA